MDNGAKPAPAQWMLSRDGKTYGPMSPGQLKKLCETGKIHPDDLICRAGAEKWIAAGEVRGLFPAPPQPPAASGPVEVRPVEEATTAASQNADAYWKTVGSLFCFANLAVCAVVGLVKSPPGIVEAMQQLKQTTDEMTRDLGNLNATVVDPTKTAREYMDEAKKASQRE